MNMNLNNNLTDEDKKSNLKSVKSSLYSKNINKNRKESYRLGKEQSTFQSSISDNLGAKIEFYPQKEIDEANQSQNSKSSDTLLYALLYNKILDNLNKNNGTEDNDKIFKILEKEDLTKIFDKCLAKTLAKSFISEVMNRIDVNKIFKENIGKFFINKITEIKQPDRVENANNLDDTENANQINKFLKNPNSSLRSLEENRSNMSNSKLSRKGNKKQTHKVNDCSHKTEPHYAKNMCKSCYFKNGRDKKASCHPEKPLYALGICKQCYQYRYAKNRRRKKKANFDSQPKNIHYDQLESIHFNNDSMNWINNDVQSMNQIELNGNNLFTPLRERDNILFLSKEGSHSTLSEHYDPVDLI